VEFNVEENGLRKPRMVVDNVEPAKKEFPLDKFYQLLTKQCDISYKDMYTILTFLNDFRC